MRRMQSVQNAAARMITDASRRDHIKPILRQLHWLPVRRRVDFKIAVLVFPVLDRSGTGLPGGGMSARRRCQRSSTSICRYSDLCHAPHVQHLRRPMLRSCGSTAMELVANQSKKISQSGTIQAFVKDISV